MTQDETGREERRLVYQLRECNPVHNGEYIEVRWDLTHDEAIALITARDEARDAELVERIIGEIVEWWGGSYPMVERIIRDAARRTK